MISPNGIFQCRIIPETDLKVCYEQGNVNGKRAEQEAEKGMDFFVFKVGFFFFVCRKLCNCLHSFFNAFVLKSHQLCNRNTEFFCQRLQQRNVGKIQSAFPFADGCCGNVKSFCKIFLRPSFFFSDPRNVCFGYCVSVSSFLMVASVCTIMSRQSSEDSPLTSFTEK